MASPPDVIIDGPRKGPNETTVTAHKYDLDGVDDEVDDYHGAKSLSFTRNDRKDMARMGKTQELRVSNITSSTGHG
jgi:hypothetical protein